MTKTQGWILIALAIGALAGVPAHWVYRQWECRQINVSPYPVLRREIGCPMKDTIFD